MALVRPTPATAIRPSTRRLPFVEELTAMLEGLVGREVSLTPTAATGAPSHTALYVERSGLATAAVQFDLALAAASGASLALIPASKAAEWVAAGRLSDEGNENASEILNVLAAAFNQRDTHRHVKLDSVVIAPDPVPGDAALALAHPGARADYAAQVEGYPAGHLGVMAL